MLLRILGVFTYKKGSKIRKADACSTLTRIMRFKLSGMFTGTKM